MSVLWAKSLLSTLLGRKIKPLPNYALHSLNNPCILFPGRHFLPICGLRSQSGNDESIWTRRHIYIYPYNTFTKEKGSLAIFNNEETFR